MTSEYNRPIRLEVDYQPYHGRRSVFFRALIALPAYVLIALFVVPIAMQPDSLLDWIFFALGQGAGPGFLTVLSCATGAMITFRRRYPRWWFDAHSEIVRWGVRFLAYMALLTDRYPPTDREFEVRVSIQTPAVNSPRDRRIALMKWAFLTPHYVVLYFLTSLAMAALFVVWFLLLLGRPYPKNVYAFVVYLLGWWLRIYAYGYLHLTDDYPRFGLHEPVAEVIDVESGRPIWAGHRLPVPGDGPTRGS